MEFLFIIMGILVALTATTFTGIQNKARDTERTTDIKAMHAQAEAYYAQYGNYPSLTSMNDANWRSKNMRGLDEEALRDPSGSDAKLKSKPTKKAYSYDVKTSAGKDCSETAKNCATYILTATLEDGSTYTKRNLN